MLAVVQAELARSVGRGSLGAKACLMSHPASLRPDRASRWDPFRPGNLRRIIWLLVVGWTVVSAVSLQQSWRLLQDGALKLAAKEAANSLAEDLAYRHWATLHGGVYVPVAPGTSPSPYLAGLPERDVVTPSGRQLTLLNPEYMIRQVYDDADGPSRRHRHLTSLKPLRPQNAPDEWRRRRCARLRRAKKTSARW